MKFSYSFSVIGWQNINSWSYLIAISYSNTNEKELSSLFDESQVYDIGHFNWEKTKSDMVSLQ